MRKLMFIIMVMLTFAMLSGCRTTKTIETVRDVYKTRTDTVKDSIYRDVLREIWVKGDTIHEKSTEYVYRDRWRSKTDTLLRRDTVSQIVTVKESIPQTWWDETKLSTWSLLLAIAIIEAFGLFIILKQRWL